MERRVTHLTQTESGGGQSQEGALQVGDTLEGWRLTHLLGRGGFGQVFRGERGTASAAIKVLHPDLARGESGRRLKEEIKTLMRLPQHRNLVRVDDFGFDAGRGCWYLAMAYIEGPSLAAHLKAQGGLEEATIRALIRQLAEGLAVAHDAGIVHRDIKPENIILRPDGTPVLVDFGIAVASRGSGATRYTSNALSAHFACPEQHRGLPAGAPCDVYALAATLYYTLAYRDAAERDQTPDADSPAIGEAWRPLLAKALANRPERRFQHAGEMLQALEEPQRPQLPAIEKIHGWSDGGDYRRVQALQHQTAAALGREVSFQDRLADGSAGPEMVIIPAGRFLMGSPGEEPGRYDNETQHEVTLERPFALGRYAVTRSEFETFVAASGYLTDAERGDGAYGWSGTGWKRDKRRNWRTPGFEQAGDHPVVCVSWNDAMAYIAWLAEETDNSYRLPSEAEWEYACRAGTTTPFWWGGSITPAQANYNGNFVYEGGGKKGEYRQKTLPAKSFEPNPWGLYQLHGNVWEWSGSEYAQSYDGREQRCEGNNHAGGPLALRGGSWGSEPLGVRSAFRFGGDAGDRNFYIGFRLAQDLSL